MITPITEDAVWLQQFEGVPPLDLPMGPVLLLAPHPDDETLGAGALIATLRALDVPVTVVAATDGENAYDTAASERIALGLVREREQCEALAVLGVGESFIERFRLKDSGLAACEAELTQRLSELAGPGVTLIAPWTGDFHPDHEACARAAAAVALKKGLRLIYYFFWTWHRGSPDLLDGLSVRRFDASYDALAAKTAAMLQHRSQLEQFTRDAILSERLLAPSHWPFEVFLPA